MSCVEEEIDSMSEYFLQLSVQLQKRTQISTILKEREISAGDEVVLKINVMCIHFCKFEIALNTSLF